VRQAFPQLAAQFLDVEGANKRADCTRRITQYTNEASKLHNDF